MRKSDEIRSGKRICKDVGLSKVILVSLLMTFIHHDINLTVCAQEEYKIKGPRGSGGRGEVYFHIFVVSYRVEWQLSEKIFGTKKY